MASSKWPIVSRPRQRRNHFTHGSARREQFGATQHGPIQLVCVKVPLFRQVRTRRALPAVSPGATGSNEGESQKAGAKKGKSRRGQGKKAIGNEVLISHHTPSDLDARWNLLKLSERPFRKKRSTLPPRSNPRTDSVKRMGQENSGADQTHYCRHCLNHCQRPLRPCATENGGDLAQSKRFPVASTQSRSTEDSAQQVFQNRAGWRLRKARSTR